MKLRLKETLDDKRDLEIEMLQVQKNYVRTKNEAKGLREKLANSGAPTGMSIEDKKRLADAHKFD